MTHILLFFDHRLIEETKSKTALIRITLGNINAFLERNKTLT